MVKKMSRVCSPKWLCTQNLLIFFVGFIGVMVGYLYYIVLSKISNGKPDTVYVDKLSSSTTQVNIEPDPRAEFSNPYTPPLKTDNVVVTAPINTAGLGRKVVAVPVNVSTSVVETPYTQMGILTKQTGKNAEPVILPLMGRSLWNGRDKWMYYTMTNTAGSINTRLPLRVNGKSGTNEYGCDMISTGDTIYVDGYDETFRATIYENAVLRYLPVV